MPDGDRFERQLWGMGLKKAYRLACGNGKLDDLVPLLYNAKNHLLRNGLDCPVIAKIGAAIHRALNRPLLTNDENINWLFQELDNISASQNDSHGTRLAVNAGKAICAELVSARREMKINDVIRQVRNKFTAKLLDDQFFSRTREGIMAKTGRVIKDQLDWENKLTEEVISYSRTSTRWLSSQNQVWDKDRLFRPLTVLEG